MTVWTWWCFEVWTFMTGQPTHLKVGLERYTTSFLHTLKKREKYVLTWFTRHNKIHCVSKNCADLFLSEVRDISTDFNNFWRVDGKRSEILLYSLPPHLICVATLPCKTQKFEISAQHSVCDRILYTNSKAGCKKIYKIAEIKYSAVRIYQQHIKIIGGLLLLK